MSLKLTAIKLRQEKAKVCKHKRSYYRNTRCTNTAQEEHSDLPGGVIYTFQDSDDDEDYNGEQLEISKEMQELRGSNQWINQVGWDAASEAQVMSKRTHTTISLRLDWADVKKRLADSASC